LEIKHFGELTVMQMSVVGGFN